MLLQAVGYFEMHLLISLFICFVFNCLGLMDKEIKREKQVDKKYFKNQRPNIVNLNIYNSIRLFSYQS